MAYEHQDWKWATAFSLGKIYRKFKKCFWAWDKLERKLFDYWLVKIQAYYKPTMTKTSIDLQRERERGRETDFKRFLHTKLKIALFVSLSN